MAVIDQPQRTEPANAICRLRVTRSKREDGAPHVDDFDVPVHEHLSLLDALEWIKLHRDPTLAVQHSCLHASCGTCGVRVDGRQELACLCMMDAHGGEMTVEPLANLPVLTDAVVDMQPFYERFPAEHPIIRTSETPAGAEPPEGHDAYVRLEDCIECALCLSACPVDAEATGFVGPAGLEAAHRLLDEPRGADREDILTWAGRPEGVWQCTTCMACVQACPMGIDPLTGIIDLRRALMDRGELDPLLATTLQGIAQQGNSFGTSARRRPRWSRDLDFAVPDARREAVTYLWFMGDYAAFDPRGSRESRRLAGILHDAGVSFGTLGDGERNSGNDVMRVGEQGLFELLAQRNMAALNEARYEAIFTTDPHSLNALANEYPKLGLTAPVYHHTELLARLVDAGTLAIAPTLGGVRVTYHDPCYLARYNHITDAPRRLITATGAELVEMPRNGADTFCCGAGGGRIWMAEAERGERPSEQRIREAQGLAGLSCFVVSCPKDLAMYTAAAEAVGETGFEVIDLIALLERAGVARAAGEAGGGSA